MTAAENDKGVPMFVPSCTDMFDRTRLESATLALVGGGGELQQGVATSAARRLLDLGVGPMAAGRGCVSVFQVQPFGECDSGPLAWASRFAECREVVTFSLDQAPTAGHQPVDLAIAWFNLDSLAGGIRTMDPVGRGRGPCTASVVTGRGGIVASIFAPDPNSVCDCPSQPGFVYLH